MKLKELYAIAKKEIGDLSPLENADFRLEQAELNKDDNTWEIVVSYLVENVNKPRTTFSPLLTTTEYPFHRLYKKVKINDKNEVIGFYIFNANE
jgi:hypothetical protein